MISVIWFKWPVFSHRNLNIYSKAQMSCQKLHTEILQLVKWEVEMFELVSTSLQREYVGESVPRVVNLLSQLSMVDVHIRCYIDTVFQEWTWRVYTSSLQQSESSDWRSVSALCLRRSYTSRVRHCSRTWGRLCRGYRNNSTLSSQIRTVSLSAAELKLVSLSCDLLRFVLPCS